MGVFYSKSASAKPSLEIHETYILPLLVVLAVTIALIVLVLAEGNTRDLVEL